jgi:hypothetical protein
MLNEGDRLAVLGKLIDCVAEGGQLLIVDEGSSMAGFKSVLSKHSEVWTAFYEKAGYLFVNHFV